MHIRDLASHWPGGRATAFCEFSIGRRLSDAVGNDGVSTNQRSCLVYRRSPIGRAPTSMRISRRLGPTRRTWPTCCRVQLAASASAGYANVLLFCFLSYANILLFLISPFPLLLR
jgi:hypothetical protein